MLRLLERRGLLDDGADYGNEEPPLLSLLAAASVQGRVALGPRAGQPVGRVSARADREPFFLPGELCAQLDGFYLHARVRVSPRDRERLERLCRYVARPAVAG